MDKIRIAERNHSEKEKEYQKLKYLERKASQYHSVD
jgi:hypothetical protein